VADRTARVVLDLIVDRFTRNASQASQAVRDVGEAAERAGQRTDRATSRATDSVRQVATQHQTAARGWSSTALRCTP